MGGTEATVVRVAEALAETGRYEVIVAQHCRKELGKGKAAYIPLDAVDQIGKDPHAVVALRSLKLIPFVRKNWTDSKKFLWCHDFGHRDLIEDYPVLRGTGVKVLGVSRTHKTWMVDIFLNQIGDPTGVTVDHVYNPIADALSQDETPVDRNKLVFFSSPHKGLDRTLEVFALLKKQVPEFTLYVANPGYYPDRDIKGQEGVVNLGPLPHAEILKHVRGALCVFHLNRVFPETFGLVYAEANAVGTPCLTEPRGAAYEVLGSKQQLLNVQDTEEVVKRVLEWRAGSRPAVKANPEFRMSAVLKKWESLF